jgi:hypothetical protein
MQQAPSTTPTTITTAEEFIAMMAPIDDITVTPYRRPLVHRLAARWAGPTRRTR